MAKKDKKKRKAESARSVLVVHPIRVGRHNETEGVTIMSWNQEPNEPDQASENQGGDEEANAQPSAGDALRALDNLERFHDRNRDEFLRMAAVQELGPQLREALNVLLKLSPEAMQTLAEIVGLPADEQRLIRRAVDLPDEVKSALRGLLDE